MTDGARGGICNRPIQRWVDSTKQVLPQDPSTPNQEESSLDFISFLSLAIRPAKGYTTTRAKDSLISQSPAASCLSIVSSLSGESQLD